MEKECRFGQIKEDMKAIGLRTKSKVKALTLKKTEQPTMVIGKITGGKAMEPSHGQMAPNISATGLTIKNKDKDNIFGKMEPSMMVNGLLTKDKVKEPKKQPMANVM